MNISLHYLGQLRHIAGVESEEHSVADTTTLIDLLQQVAAGHDEGFGRILFDDAGALRASVMVLINDAPVEKASPPALADGASVTLLPAIAGG